MRRREPRANPTRQRAIDPLAALGARWLADSAPTHLDHALIDRIADRRMDRDHLAAIRFHRGKRAQAAADALDARAFALGDRDIFVGSGAWDPASATGRGVLAHEVAHAVEPPARDMAERVVAEQRAERHEARVFAQEQRPPSNAPRQHASQRTWSAVDVARLEQKVVECLARGARLDDERLG